jgi:predicted Rossmann-fold nucleotide-binding protein
MLHKMVEERTIHPDDLNLVLFTDDTDEALRHIQHYVKQNYTVKRLRPRRWLAEKKLHKEKA